jgi:transposase-like protein
LSALTYLLRPDQARGSTSPEARLNENELEELERLHKKNRMLRMEEEILKKPVITS